MELAGAIFPAYWGLGALVGLGASASRGPPSDQGVRLLAVVLVVLAAFLLYLALGGDRLARDLKDGRVAAVEGAFKKRTVTYGRYRTTNCYLDVASRSFRVPEATFRAAPAAGSIRLYYLPRTKRIVNLERLHGETQSDSAGISTRDTG